MVENNQPRWKEVEYSRSQIIKAGKIIRNSDSSTEQIAEATQIIDNWRAAHSYPLHVIYIHLRRLAEKNTNIIVAERLKRLDSIVNKLKREPNMSLWTMQDLGGCRFIVPTLEEVYDYANKYKKSRIRHKYIQTYDYIQNPKKSGYRSLHIVYQFQSDKKLTYNRNMLIELQFRTKLQHLWATAVETMGLFTKQALKAGDGDTDVKRFFAVISSIFAIRENTTVVPNTLHDLNELVSEVEEINSRRHFLDTLQAIKVAIDHESDKKSNQQGYYILILNYNTRRLRIIHFKPSEMDKANKVYSQIEQTKSESQIDAVLVRVSSLQSLKAAYPNYFSDIAEFVNIVKEYLS